jgi:hypothetical protein
MARFIKFKDLLNMGKAKTPGFGISKSFYLSVLANAPVLPPLTAIVNPKGTGGAIKGFGVPLKVGARKEEIAEPLMRGMYGIASLDQKTALKLTVISKEEAGFDPSPMLQSASGMALDPEVRTRIAAAWNLMQVTFESHDPAVYPALDFLMGIVRKMALLTDGVIADPMCQAYRLPHGQEEVHDEGLPFSTESHIAIRQLPRGPGFHLSTLGLAKFAMHEVEIDGVDQAAVAAGKMMLLGVAQSCLQGKKVEPGDRLGSPAKPLRVAEGGLDRGMWDGIPCLELIPDIQGETSASLLAWHDEQLRST